MNTAPRYFHGGKPGLGIGDLVVPGHPNYVDGCAICDALKAGKETPFDSVSHRADQVFVTTDREYARFYASKYPGGDLYVVEPIGELTASSEDHFPTWSCASARVVSIYARFVCMTYRQRVTLSNRWKRADKIAAAAKALDQPEAVPVDGSASEAT